MTDSLVDVPSSQGIMKEVKEPLWMSLRQQALYLNGLGAALMIAWWSVCGEVTVCHWHRSHCYVLQIRKLSII